MRTVEELYRLQCQCDLFADQAQITAESYDEKANNTSVEGFRKVYLKLAESRRNSAKFWQESAEFYADEIKYARRLKRIAGKV